MSKPVLGRDPFTQPVPTAAKPQKKTKTVKKPPPPPAPPDVLKNRGRPQTMERQTTPQTSRADAKKEIDRVELLEGTEAQAGPFQNLLNKSTRFVRPDYYGQKLGEVGMRFRAEEVDPFGFDPVYWEKLEPIFEFLFDNYFRVDLFGLQNVPDQGRVLLVANHSGTLPYDGAMLKVAVENRHMSGRPVRFLVEDFVFHFPFLGSFMNRIGGVRACQDNARRLLQNEQLVVVFPEGVKGIGKLFWDRYKLQRFGRGGFIKLALRTNSPIIPVAVVGAEEIHPMLARLDFLARTLKLPYIPVTPTFPLLGPLGAIPLPSKWLIQFGRPISLAQYTPEDADDALKIMQLAEKVRSTIQQMVNELLKKRKTAFT
jgi:1-acyl-sn-glycerol-3-phosphate acyltransferase